VEDPLWDVEEYIEFSKKLNDKWVEHKMELYKEPVCNPIQKKTE
jgi:hypothetical protein